MKFRGPFLSNKEDARVDLLWLKSIMNNELDLRPPFLARVGKNCIFIRDEKGKPISGFILDNTPYDKSKILITKNYIIKIL